MWKRVRLGLLLFLLLLVGAGVWTARAIGPLTELEVLLTGNIEDLDDPELARAADSLDRAHSILASPPARFLRWFPLLRQNIAAVDHVSVAAKQVVDDARVLKDVGDASLGEGLVDEGTIVLPAVERIADAVSAQVDSLTVLERTVTERIGGWLLPPLWSRMEELQERSSSLLETARPAGKVIELAPALLGDDSEREYLVLLLNNAELRGAGGIITGIGTVTFVAGDLEVKRFGYYADIRGAAGTQKVEAPPDLARRFGRYQADTTLLINTTASPDVPEVAQTAAAINQATGGRQVDGVILLDPRGLGALLGDEEVTEAESGTDLSGKDVPGFVFSDAYEVFEGDEAARRESLLRLGPQILRKVGAAAPDRDELEAIGRTVEEGHIRIVSFDPEEQEALEALGVSGELTTGASDSLLVTTQNLGADKLDFWMRRNIDHSCEVVEGGARCSTTVTLTNETPRGLPSYVVQDKEPYGIYKGYLEIYVPSEAEVTGYKVSGSGTDAFTEEEDGRASLGTRFRTLRGATTIAEVQYELPIEEEAYSLEITPQPLAVDATLSVSVEVPEGWRIGVRGEEGAGPFTYEGPLAQPLVIEAYPVEGPPGIPGIWRSIERFWREPVL